MPIALGIDTGGTYTDAVLIDYESSRVVAHTKALTTRGDLSIGIREALRRVLADGPQAPDNIGMVSVSTTLATNAIVEGNGAPVAALLIGYDGRAADLARLMGELGVDHHALIQGGHLSTGEEAAPLDVMAAREAILATRDHVAAYAVSSYFGTRNPAHEIAVRDLVRDLTGLPITCGHALTHRLDALRRAATVCLNARLIPLVCGLIAAVERTMAEEGIRAPLMVVKGDGSLMAAAVAKERPIETILSGPAASVVGARHLAEAALGSGSADAVVVDMGGTTTDIAVLAEGRPRLSPQGAQVGPWRTMVEAIDVHTVGLGGDSRVWLDEGGDLRVGPRRVGPISWLGASHPEVYKVLADQAEGNLRDATTAGEFLMLQRDYALGEPGEPPFAAALRAALAEGPQALDAIYRMMRYPSLYMGYLQRLERTGALLRCGFTPTDAAHVLGCYEAWDAACARQAAALLGRRLRVSAEELSARVIGQTSEMVAREVVTKALADGDRGNGHYPEADGSLIGRALRPREGEAVRCMLTLQPRLVAVGAPVGAYFPRVAELLHADLAIPPQSEVANAVGAVVGSVVARLHLLVVPQDDGAVYRVHLPDEAADRPSLSEALSYAEQRGRALALEEALRAGAADVEVTMTRRDQTAPVANGWGEDLYIQTVLEVTAVGRPQLALR